MITLPIYWRSINIEGHRKKRREKILLNKKSCKFYKSCSYFKWQKKIWKITKIPTNLAPSFPPFSPLFYTHHHPHQHPLLILHLSNWFIQWLAGTKTVRLSWLCNCGICTVEQLSPACVRETSQTDDGYGTWCLSLDRTVRVVNFSLFSTLQEIFSRFSHSPSSVKTLAMAMGAREGINWCCPTSAGSKLQYDAYLRVSHYPLTCVCAWACRCFR